MKGKKSTTFVGKSSNINTLMINVIIGLKTIAIILVNTDVLNIACLI